ncbi:hypothetical protein C7974DRAFT_422930 [Boeremia exigua]|uniref:uncharacterized protein n=1 Tax=Boeremia exigua TaxID=749465 RepID=UPI001E8CC41E|nr:uncharacterized protein C7974DRAFT_422930 [Boeremia exigua]KAH6637987.1 hypothetical protein C7974DRAFT_422930 [Boeremia exigua]
MFGRCPVVWLSLHHLLVPLRISVPFYGILCLYTSQTTFCAFVYDPRVWRSFGVASHLELLTFVAWFCTNSQRIERSRLHKCHSSTGFGCFAPLGKDALCA